MMPGSSPMWHFAAALVSTLAGRDVPDHSQTAKTRLRLNRGAEGFAEVLGEMGFADEQSLFILVDQFEEIFRFANEGGMREAADFIRLLVGLHIRCPDNVYVALTMRSDHLGDCSRFPGLSEIVNAAQYLVPPMDETELEDAICQPAKIYDGKVDNALARKLIRDTRHSSDQLPLIQHALAYMWRLEQSKNPGEKPHLTPDSYTDAAVGSAVKALSNHADSVLTELMMRHPGAPKTTEAVFRALTQVDDNGRAIRRRLTRKELMNEVGGSEEILDDVIAAFSEEDRSFLVTEDPVPEQDSKIDISHEALIRHWNKLSNEGLDDNGQPRGWIAREVSDGRIWQSLVATVEGDENSEEVYLPKAIYENRRTWWKWLNPTPAWAEKHGDQFRKVEQLFERSRNRIEQEELRALEQARTEKLARTLAKCLFWVFVVAALGLGVLTYHTWQQSDRIRNQKAVAVRALRAQWQYTSDAAKNSEKNKLLDPVTGILIALEFLPDQSSRNSDRRNWPLIPGVEQALEDALKQYESVKAVLKGHKNEVDGIACSPDGKLIATGSKDDTLRIWDARTGELHRELKGHSGDVVRVAFSPDSTRIVSGSRDNTAHIWNAETGEELRRLEGHKSDIWGVAWSPDGVHVATGSSERTVRIWNAETGADILQLSGHSAAVHDVAFNPDGSRIVSVSSDKTVRIWDVKTGAELLQFKGHGGTVYGAAWSSDGKLIATGSGDRTVRIWEADSGRQRFELGHKAAVLGVAFSPDGRWLATGSNDKLGRIWDVNTGKLIRTLTGHRNGVDVIAWSPDGTRVVTGSDDSTARILVAIVDEAMQKFFNGTTQAVVDRAKQVVPRCLDEKKRAMLILPKEPPRWCRDMRKPPFDARGRFEHGISLLKQKTPNFDGAENLFKEAKTLDASLADDFKRREIGVLKERGLKALSRGVESFTKIDPALQDADRFLDRAAALDSSLRNEFKDAKFGFFIESGRRMLVGGRMNEANKAFDKALSLDPTAQDTVIVARIEAAQELGKTELAILLALELDPSRDDAQQVLSKILEGMAPQMLLKGHKDQVDGIAYSPDGKLIVTGSKDDTLRIWDARTGELRRELKGHSGDVTRVAVSPDSTRIVSGSHDNTARIWNVETGEELRRLEGHKNDIWGVAWSPDGLNVATASSDRTVRIWNAETGADILQFSGHSAAVRDVAINPDGSRIVSASSDRTARVWDVKTGAELLRFKEHGGTVYGAAWSSDGKLIATGSSDRTVRIWEADSGRQRFKLGHNAAAWGVAFSPDGRWLATGSDDNLGRIWDVRAGELIRTLTGHKKGVDIISWSPDGTRLVTGSDDSTARIYDTSTLDMMQQSLISRAQKRVKRCLTRDERAEFNLIPQIPAWCNSLGLRNSQQPTLRK
jgi:WD40 repeat protein